MADEGIPMGAVIADRLEVEVSWLAGFWNAWASSMGKHIKQKSGRQLDGRIARRATVRPFAIVVVSRDHHHVGDGKIAERITFEGHRRNVRLVRQVRQSDTVRYVRSRRRLSRPSTPVVDSRSWELSSERVCGAAEV